MKATVDRKALSDAMTACLRAVDRRATIPVCSHFLVRCADDRIFLTATDLDFAITCSAPGENDEPGAWTMDAETAAGFVKRAKGDLVEFTYGQVGVEIRVGRSALQLRAGDRETFPTIAASGDAFEFVLPGEHLRAGLLACLWAVAEPGSRAHWLCGVSLRPDAVADLLRFTGANGSAVGAATCPLPKGAKSMPATILPTRAAEEAARLAESDVTVRARAGSISFAFASGTSLVSKVIEGQYPDVDALFAMRTTALALSQAKDLSAALDRVSLTTDKRRPTGLGVKLTVGPDKLVIERRDAALGSIVEDIDTNSDFPSDQAVGLNAEWFKAAVAAIGHEAVTIGIGRSGNSLATLLRTPGHDFPVAGIGTMGVQF